MVLVTLILLVWTASVFSVLHFEGGDLVPSLYWTIVTCTTIGYGDITPDTIAETYFALFVGAAGATYFASIVANITSVMHSTDISEVIQRAGVTIAWEPV